MMRVSVESNDIGRPYYDMLCANGKRALIYLDGVSQKYVLTADEERGFIIRAKTDEAGQVVIAPNGEDLEVEQKLGEVRVEIVEL